MNGALLAGFRFSTDLPVWLVLVGALAAGLLVMLLYLRETSVLHSPWSWLLPGMRGTAVVLACLLLAGPVWHRRQIIGNPARIVWAVDRSQSMAEDDSGAGGTEDRLRRSTDLLFGAQNNEGWLARLRETHLMDVVTFDDASRLAWSSDMQSDAQEPLKIDPNDPRTQLEAQAKRLLDTADGRLTDLSSPLRTVLEGTRTHATEGSTSTIDSDAEPLSQDDSATSSRVVVMFSDGRDTAGRADASEIATQLADAGWQVHTLGMGSVDEAADVGVVDVDVPERVADDGRLAGRVWIKHFGLEQRDMRVDIRSGEQVMWSETMPIAGDGKSPVDFDFAVETLMQRASANDIRGVDRESVALSLSADVSLLGTPDAKTANNSMSFRVAAASRDRQLLILAGSPRWEIRYLRNLFSRDPAWAVDTVLFGPGTDTPVVARGEEPGELPVSSRAWSRYDAVILGEIPPDQWTREDADHLSEFVAAGGGLIVIDGRYGRIEDLVSITAAPPPSTGPYPRSGDTGREQSVDAMMAGLIPVRFSRDDRSAKIESILPTDAGRTHPVMLLDVADDGGAGATGGVGGTGAIWKHLPAPSSINVVVPSPDAEIWADAIDVDGKSMPWLVTRLFGAGRVFYFSSGQTWRWRYKVESRLHSRFWNQLISAAMQPPYAVRDDFVAIGTDKIDYRVGQSATIRARLLGTSGGSFSSGDPSSSGGPMSSGGTGSQSPARTVDALLLRDGQVVATLPMRLEDAQRRTYVGQTDALPEGEYRVRVRASGFDAAALKASTPIWVVPRRGGELDRVSLDEASLQRIAHSGGGVYVHESSAAEVLANLQPLSGGRIVESDLLLWQSWWVFVIIIALLGVEWWLRKKVGLI